MTCKRCETCGQAIRGTRIGRKLDGSKNQPRLRVADNQDALMQAMYREGMTLEQIGRQYGITRERVRQRLARNGISRKEGGAHIKATPGLMAKAKESTARREAKCMKTYGCDLVTYGRLSMGMVASDRSSPMRKFIEQRSNAGKRNIPWELTFAEWMEMWIASGKWEHRGLGIGKYCMARKMDTGSYCLENVYITTCDDNVRDYQARLKADGIPCDDGYKRLPENPIFEELSK